MKLLVSGASMVRLISASKHEPCDAANDVFTRKGGRIWGEGAIAIGNAPNAEQFIALFITVI
ncbi:hypothetical protein [Acaryochloris marina]|uniref:hypothetical protein n=1 Tax=Acaryochloris marina TaxID=155978 RepID=UPI001BB09CBE|nr:hypothetical protein [Acaryochloris marina]QUY45413.1 hypothetical protein I1H34_14920 [Acaryochloris marina S15]